MGKELRKALTLIVVIALASGCSSKHTIVVPMPTKTCDIDAQKICENGAEEHAAEAAKNPSSSPSFFSRLLFWRKPTVVPDTFQSWVYTFTTPNQVTVQVSCTFDMQKHKVVNAETLGKPVQSDTAIDFLISQDLCKDQKK